MKISSRIQERLSILENAIQNFISIREPKTLYEPMSYVVQAGGKRLRPLLLLLSCEGVRGDIKQCLDAAIAIELLHTFTLVHDDIMDHDHLRRGVPTVHTKWDEATAILAGDGLVTLSFSALLRTPHPRILEVIRKFAEGLLIVCEGQALDKAFETLDEITLDQYLDMIQRKTAKLIALSCETGAILGNGTSKECESMEKFGFHLGCAFQIQDDLLDLISTNAILGKPVGSDLTRKKKTFLSTHFLAHANKQDKKRFFKLCGKSSLSIEEIEEIKTAFEKIGTLAAARNAIETAIQNGLSFLKQLPATEVREDLETLALNLLDRKF